MPQFILKLQDKYLLWSTIVDAPITFGMPLDEFLSYYRAEYGNRSMPNLFNRMKRVEETGTSEVTGYTIQDLISHNRAGPNEVELTEEEIYTAYCKQESIRDGWVVPVTNEDK